MSRYVVLDETSRFLSGLRHWSSEYPDARLFSTVSVAATAASDAGGGRVVEDYGLDSERVCLVTDADGNIHTPAETTRGAHE